MRAKLLLAGTAILIAPAQTVFGWGDDGHKAIALVAERCLTSITRQTIASLLASDTDSLTPHDIASESTWADKYREPDNRQDHYQQTRKWHYTDIEIDTPDLDKACFGRPPLPAGTLASNGPPDACAVDKIKQFTSELAAPNADAEERLSNPGKKIFFSGASAIPQPPP
jgi:nuclease S1